MSNGRQGTGTGTGDIPGVIRVVRAARSRLRRRVAITTTGRVLPLLGVLGLGALLAAWWWALGPWDWAWWGVPAGVLVLALLTGVLMAVTTRIDARRAAGLVDEGLGLSDRLSSAIEFAHAGSGGFATLARADADRVAAQARVEQAVPVRMGRGWRIGGALVILTVGLGIGLPDRAGVLEQRRAEAQRSRELAAERLRETRESLASVIEEAATQPQDPDSPEQPDEGTLRAFEELERALAEGEKDPEEALAEAAAELEREAEDRERVAIAAEETSRGLDERLDELDADEFEQARNLAERLRDRDLEGASESARELLEQAERMTPEERERLADELDRLAERLQAEDEPASGEPGTEESQQTDDPQQNDEQTTEPEGSEQDPAESGGPENSEQPDEPRDPSEQLREALEREAQRLREQPPSETSEQNDPQQPPSQQDPPQQGQEQQGQEQQGSEQQGSEQQGQEQQGQEQQGQEQQGQEQQGQEQQGQEQQGQEQQGQEQQGQEQQGQEQQGQEQQGQEQQGQEQQGQEQQGQEQQGQEQQGQEQQGQEQQGQEQQGQEQQGQEQQGQEQQGQEQQGQEQQGQEQQGQEQQGREGQSEGQRSLEEVLREAAEGQEQGRRARRDSESLRREAERLLEQMDESERQGLAEDLNMPPESESGGRRPGEGLTRDPSGDPFQETVPVDARPEDPQGEGGRVISEWLGEGQEGELPPEAREEIRRAAGTAERAIEQQRVPSRHKDLVRKVFRRWQERADDPTGGVVAPLGQDAPPAGSSGGAGSSGSEDGV